MNIQREVFLKAAPERVWRALTDTGEFTRWFGDTVEGEFVAGQPVWMISGGVRFEVRIEEMRAPSLFRWSWHPGMPDPEVDYASEPRTQVTFRLEPHNGGTLLTVTESGFDRLSLARRSTVFAENEQGWEIQVRNLATYVGSTS